MRQRVRFFGCKFRGSLRVSLKNTGKKSRKPIIYRVCEKGIECIVETFEEVLNIVMFKPYKIY